MSEDRPLSRHIWTCLDHDSPLDFLKFTPVTHAIPIQLSLLGPQLLEVQK